MHASNLVPTVRIQISHKRYWFPYANKTGLKNMHHPQFLAPEKHPIVHDLDGTQTEDIPNYVKFRKTHTGQVLSVLDDFQMGMALRLLPVRSRFCYKFQTYNNGHLNHAPQLRLRDTATDFYNTYEWDVGGAKLRTCDKASGNCMDSALVSGMTFVSAKYDGLTRIDTEHNITFVDGSAPGKFVIQLNNGQTWVLYASDSSLSLRLEESVAFSPNSSGSSLVADKAYAGTIRVALLPGDAAGYTVYDEFASCMVLGGVSDGVFFELGCYIVITVW
ncbi:Endo-1,3(4)-beta-glucanase 1 [Phytophthora megakarya]|uniref:Endo-1,3(4)-beta-glucanase 1 n=1 Tax=Phytophthora megakarya TaxID=4795 RepID=A0A225V6J6_9STRA|nr:Endo-1,3(4)-beta-glucanase 1 [Phytophthora megakarya]